MLRVFTALMLFVSAASWASGFEIVCLLGNRLVGMSGTLKTQKQLLVYALAEPKALMDRLRQGSSFIDATKDVVLLNTPQLAELSRG